MSEEKMQAVEKLTDEQFDRIVWAVKELARRNNQFAQAIVKAWGSKPREQRLAIFKRAYTAMYELMLVAQMAITSTKSPEEAQQVLESKK